MIPLIPIPENAACQEASILSEKDYIPCGATAMCIVYHEKDSRGYFMCMPCAYHNIRSRGGRVVTAMTESSYRFLLTRESR